MSEFKVGDRAVAKVGRNEINVEILAVEEKSYFVRNNAGREFHAIRLTALPDANGVGNTDTIATEPEKKCSLLDAAVEVLRIAKQPMNTREIIEWAMKLELWQPTGAKTPEQTLYGAIVRENKTKEHPRIVKSDIKGKFLYAGL